MDPIKSALSYITLNYVFALVQSVAHVVRLGESRA
jgi:hypothetical protein